MSEGMNVITPNSDQPAQPGYDHSLFNWSAMPTRPPLDESVPRRLHLSVIVDLGGRDEYRGSDLVVRGLSAIVDLAGDDAYVMEHGLGAAIAGAGLLIDYAGDDRYEGRFFAQGAAAFDIGAEIARVEGIPQQKLEALLTYADSDVLTTVEKLVVERLRPQPRLS
jgi:hypothetical protein